MQIRFKPIAGFLILTGALYSGAKFIDKDTLEVVATGKARKTGSPMRDQMSCKEAGRNEALRIAIETLVDMNWPNVKGKVSRKKYGEKVTQTTEGSIKGAHVTTTSVDESRDPVTCTVTMHILRLDPVTTHQRTMQALEEEAPRK